MSTDAAPRQILQSCTHPAWFGRSSGDLLALLSDHLHCERKAAENALSLVRRYPHRGPSVTLLGRLAHEETSHVVQVAALIGARGWVPRADTPNLYARALLAEVRGVEPQRLLDALLAAAFIEARSHERLGQLADGFERAGQSALAEFYRALAGAEERHAEIFLELAAPLVTADVFEERLAFFGRRETEILSGLPHGPRIH